MKIGAIERNFRKIKNGFNQMDNIVRHSKKGALFEHEVAIRKKLKELLELKDYKNCNKDEYELVYKDYLQLLNYVSKIILEGYNLKNNSHFKFQDIIDNNFDGYVRSGIITILVSEHIPILVAKQFDKVFPSNPKNEYKSARSFKRKIYLHLGDTNTGKTYNAMEKLKSSSKGIYLSPLRILALENFEKLNEEGIKCSLLTGEEEIIVEGFKHVCCTIEKLDLKQSYEVSVIDEIQMIGDDLRGAAWTRALLGIRSDEIHICGAENTKQLLIEIIEDLGEEYEIITYKRTIPLIVEDNAFSYRSAKVGDALVAFSKKKVLELAYYYKELGIKASIIYGDLPPEVRKKQYQLFLKKENTILITTDAIGMGVNLPIKRIIFMDIKKYDGREFRYLSSQEVKQIGGRAGRKGIYDKGYVLSFGSNQDFIRDKLNIEDEPEEKAVIGPSEEILKIKGISLKEKLVLWSTREEKIDFYTKMDITEYIMVLDYIKKYRLEEKIEWKLMRIPFDLSKDGLVKAFLSYIDEIFILKNEELNKPTYPIKELNELEIYYQKINLYYSFSKALNLQFDENWVYEERIKVSEHINELLIGTKFY